MRHEPVFLAPLPPMPFVDVTAEGMAACGVRMVEVGAWAAGFDYGNLEALGKVRKMLNAAGVEAYSYHPPFEGEYDIAVLDPEKWARAVEMNRQQIRAAAAVGARYMILHPSGPVKPEDHAAHAKRIVAAVRDLVDTCEETKVDLAMENLPPGYMAAEIGELMDLVEAAGSTRVGVCFDTGHANVMKLRMSEALAQIGGRLFTIHWHDNDGSGDQHKPPGAGNIDWDDFYAGIDAMGWDRPICPEFGPPEDWAYREYVARIRAALESNGTP
jgi:sugar phosphate isomerase/epimerase